MTPHRTAVMKAALPFSAVPFCAVPFLAVALLASCERQQATVATAPAKEAASAAPAAVSIATPAKPDVKRSVLRINATRQSWSAGQPWEKNPPNSRRALGAVVGEQLVLTTAELVADATYLEFETIDSSATATAKVIAVDYEANLALLKPVNTDDAKALFANSRVLDLAAPPKIGDALDIVQVEENGMTLTTSAALQSIDVVANFLPDQYFLTYELKASMQSAASSFSLPILHHDKLVGMLTNYDAKDQISDVGAVEITARFIREAKDGEYAGFPSLGLSTARTEDPSFRQWLKLGNDQGGLYISGVRKNSASDKAGVKKGDVVLSIDGHALDRRGYYDHPNYGSVFWSHLVRGEKSAGDEVKLSVWREGKAVDLTVKLTRDEEKDRLVPAYTFGTAPHYLVKGGFIFQELTRPLLEAFGEEWENRAPLNLLDAYENQAKYEGPARRVVFLSGVIPTPATVGYDRLRNLIVKKVNGKEIGDIESLIAAFKEAPNGLHSIEFDEDNFSVYLDEAISSKVDQQLLQRGLPKLRNPVK